MRIHCAQCSAAYAIDDRAITERGVRAQCPRCGHLQLVRRGDAPAADSSASTIQDPRFFLPPSGSDPPSGFDFLAPPPTEPEQRAAPPLVDTGGDWSAVAGGPSLPSGGDRSAFDFSALSLPAIPDAAPASGAGVGKTLGSRAGPPGDATGRWDALDVGGLVPGLEPAMAADEPLERSSATPPPIDAATPRCASCGKVLVDAFDLALGTCDRCREQPSPSAPSSGPSARAPDAVRDAPQPSRAVEPPPSRLEARAPVRTGAPPTLSQGAAPGVLPSEGGRRSPRTDGARAPVSGRHPALQVDSAATLQGAITAPVRIEREPPPSLPMAPLEAAGADYAVGASADEGGPSRAKRALQGRPVAVAAVAIAVAVAVAGVIVFVVRRPAAPPPLVEVAPEGPAAPEALEAIVKFWRLRFPELAGQPASRADDYVNEGLEALRLDSSGGYRDAEEAFAKALVLSPSHEAAAQGWALVLAFGRSGRSGSEKTVRSAERVLQYFEAKGAASRTYAAHAHLVIARAGPVTDAQSLAERAIGSAASNEDKALALVALAHAVLGRNSDQAEAHLQEALKLDPGLKRAHFFHAQIGAATGRLGDAAASLRRRLEQDKDQWEASQALGKLLVEVGELAEAKNVLRAASFAAPRNKLPLIALAALAYQHEGELDEALAKLTRVTVEADVPRDVLALAWAHTAALHRQKGNMDQAQAAVTAALDLIEDHGPALLQRCLLHLDRRVASLARLDFDAVRARLPRADVAAALEGRLLVAENRLREAQEAYAKLAAEHPFRVDALILAGAAAAKDSRVGVWDFCTKRGAEGDPYAGELEVLSDYYVRRADLVAGLRGAYDALARGSEEDPSPVLCEGLLAWHGRDLTTADARFTRVLAIDGGNGKAAAYRAFVALEKRDSSVALRFADRAVAADRNGALGHLARALALRGLNKEDQARVAAREAEKNAPKMSSIRALLGDMAALRGSRVEAKELLTGALVADPFSRAAKRALYERLR